MAAHRRTRPTGWPVGAGAPARAPALLSAPARGPVRAAVLLAHGGEEASVRAAGPLRVPALRMYPFLADLARAGAGRGLAVAQLRYRVRGYNGGDPVDDVLWGAEDLARRHPGATLCLVGHSLGARAALRAA